MTGPGIYSYSTTPASNVQSNTGINWDEGMSPAAVNNSARQNMTDMRNAFNDLIWFKYGKGDLDYSPVYASSTTFTIAGIDVTTIYHAGRRVKAVGSSTGTIYGTIKSVAFSTNTTVTMVWDSGSLSNETLTIYISQIPVTGNPSPQLFTANRAVLSSTTRSAITSSSGVMLGFGGTLALTPLFSGRFRISIAAFFTSSATQTNSLLVYYGTGSAPANGAAVTGTNPTGGNVDAATGATTPNQVNMSYSFEVTGLTIGTAYWFDLGVVAGGGSSLNASIRQVIVQEIP